MEEVLLCMLKAEPHSYENLFVYPSEKFWQSRDRTSASSSALQSSQYEISHYLASREACNLILHFHAVVTSQVSKRVSHDCIAGLSVKPSRLRVFFLSSPLTSYYDRRLNSKYISLQWLQHYCLKLMLTLLTRASPLISVKSILLFT